MIGTLLTQWTIRLALLAYCLWLALWLGQWRRPIPAAWDRAARGLYTLGCALFVAHVLCAFGFYHGFRHAAAYEDTARQTEELLGVSFGAGIYFSYLFLVLWVIDVAWLWWAPARRPAWLAPAVQLYMAFIAFNGAVVFEEGVTRWFGIPIAGALAVFALSRFRWSSSA